MKRLLTSAILSCVLTGCGIYTFSGSTLPGHLKSVDLPLFGNTSLMPGVADDITAELNRSVLGTNLLRVVPSGGDATLSGTVVAYENREYTYDVEKARTAVITEYMVRISADVEFFDNRKNEALYKGRVAGQGIYDFAAETEETGRARAVTDLVEQILQNSVQSW